MVEAVGLQVFRNVGVDQPYLAALGIRVGFRDRGLAVADRLDLGAGQRDAGLDRVLDRIIEACFSIFSDDLDGAFILVGHVTPSSGDRESRSATPLRGSASAALRARLRPSVSAGSCRG